MKKRVLILILVIFIIGCKPEIPTREAPPRMTGPGGCRTHEECEAYCREKPSECGISEEPEFTPEYSEISIPFDKENFIYDSMGIWPYCVHGGDHPEGHGGIDFELKKDTDIYASCDGKLFMIEPSEDGVEGIFIRCTGITVNIFGILGRKVELNDFVKKGDILGKSSRMHGSPSSYYIHYEIVDDIVGERVCPVNHMDEDFKIWTEEMFKFARYPEQKEEPLLCNCVHAPKAKTKGDLKK